MKLAQQQQAQRLYFHTDLSKTQIAETVGVDRRTVAYWSEENDWDRIKKSAQHMPSLIAEDLYVTLAHLTQSIVSESREGKVITEAEARTISRISLTISKLKNRGTLNENLEMLRFFMEFVTRKDPEAADIIQPLVHEYIADRAKADPWQNLAPKYNDKGFIPEVAPNLTEMQLDLQDMPTTPSLFSRMPESGTSAAHAEGGRVKPEIPKKPTNTTGTQPPTPEQQAAYQAAVARLEKYRAQLEKVSEQKPVPAPANVDEAILAPTEQSAAPDAKKADPAPADETASEKSETDWEDFSKEKFPNMNRSERRALQKICKRKNKTA